MSNLVLGILVFIFVLSLTDQCGIGPSRAIYWSLDGKQHALVLGRVK